MNATLFPADFVPNPNKNTAEQRLAAAVIKAVQKYRTSNQDGAYKLDVTDYDSQTREKVQKELEKIGFLVENYPMNEGKYVFEILNA